MVVTRVEAVTKTKYKVPFSYSRRSGIVAGKL